MSLEHVGAVLYDAENKDPYMVMILLALADLADSENGESYRSVRQIAKMSRCSERQTQNYLRLMCELGWIEVVSRSGENGASLPNKYRLIRHHKGGAQCAPGEGAQQREGEASLPDGSSSLPPQSPSSSSLPSLTLEEEERALRVPNGDLFGQSKAKPDTFETLLRYCQLIQLTWDDATYMWGNWQENGFRRGKHKIKDWKQCVRVLAAGGYLPSCKKAYKPSPLQEAYYQRLQQEQLEAEERKIQKEAAEWEANATPADRAWKANFLRIKNEEPPK